MSGWVVIVQEYDIWMEQSPTNHEFRARANAHDDIPLELGTSLPSQLIQFLANTEVGLIPVLDMAYAGVALAHHRKNYRHNVFRHRDPPDASHFLLQPYTWLLEEYRLSFTCRTVHGRLTRVCV